MASKMLIDASHPEETRVVVVRNNRIEEFDFESQHKKQLRGNIYLARVTRVEPSLQAAFVEYGGNRHGFLAFSEIHPDYYQIPFADRQALLEAEAAEHHDEDEDEQPRERRERENGRERRRGRDRGKRSASAESTGASSEGVSSETAEETTDDSDETPTVMEMAVDADEITESIGENNESGDAADKAAKRDSDDNDHDDDDHDSGHVEEQEVIESVGAEDALEELPTRRRVVRRQYKIQEVIKRRQVLLVQVVKEERGNKGAALTTYLSLAGRYSVLMPNTGRGGGISRKITSAQDRKRLKEVVKDLEVPTGMGVILRTAGANRTKVEIKRDYEYLMRAWETVRNLTLQSSAPALVYEEGSLIKRSIRDLYNKDISEILVSGENGYREAKDFMRMLMPSHAKMVQPYREPTPIFARAGIEAHLDKMLQPQVTLKSGGYIIINQTEALVSIDVNSGRSTREHSIEDTALQTNLEAAEEVARQLRLRDLAGLIVIDFIDMEEKRNNRAVEKRLKDNLKNDRARIQVGRISHFGLLEMSRQRIRASVLESTMQVCAHCGGTGHVRSQSSVGLHVIRSIEEFLLRSAANDLIVKMPVSTALYVLNQKRDSLSDLEGRFGVRISIEADEKVGAQHLIIERGGPASGVARGPILPAYDETLDEDPEIPVEDEAGEIETATVAEKPEGEQAPRAEGDPRRKRRRRRRGRNRGDEKRLNDDTANFAEQDGESTEDDEAQPEEIGVEPAAIVATIVVDEESVETAEPVARTKRRRRTAAKDKTDDVIGTEEAATPVVETVAVEDQGETKPAKAKGRRKKAVAEPAVTESAVVSEPAVALQAKPAEDKPEKPRVSRRSAGTEDVASEPKLSVSGSETEEAAAAETPRKGGWWQKRGFF